MMYRRLGFLLLLAVFVLSGLARPSQADDKEGWIKLFNGQDFTGWRKFLGKKGADPDKIFQVQDGIIVVEGSVPGYIITEKEYENYILRLEWKWGPKGPEKRRNSGVFLHVSGPDKIWPKGVEAQLMNGRAGDFWLVDGFKLHVDQSRQDPKVSRHYFRTKDNVEKPVGEWNKYEITCKGDTIKLVVNDQEVNEGTHAESTKGKILLQSEGAEIMFRNIELKQLQ